MHTTFVHFLGQRDCRFTLNGTNLANLRRAELYRAATALDIGDAQASKNDLLTAMIQKLSLLHAEDEIADLINGL